MDIQRTTEWRYCNYGLNLEGTCQNNNCIVFCSDVICNIGYNPYDIVHDSNAKCPMCNHEIKPKSFIITNCVITIIGKKTNGNFINITKTIDDKPYYPELITKNAEYDYLTIKCNHTEDCEIDNCPICFCYLKNTIITECGHYFCQKCIIEWLNIKQTCPLCITSLSLNNIQTCTNNY